MKALHHASVVIAVALLSGGCKPSEPQVAANPPAATVATWPSTLNVVGEGFPNPGDPCRVIGESAATVDFLDHTATLAGCLDAADAAKLGGRTVGVVDGVTLVSVPREGAATAGDGDGQGDATVAGTNYNATAQIRCAGYQGAPEQMCDAGVVRGTETGTYVEVKLPDGVQRTIFFDAAGKFLSFSTAQADGTAAMEITSSREGDTTVATLGTERYYVPDAFVLGD